jgi:hypothetical protein
MKGLTMKTHTFQIYADPGHAWCKVSFKKLFDLGLHDKISHYSYMRGLYAYLEEDCDLSLLIQAIKARGDSVAFKESHTNKTSKIRGYAHYHFSFF